jgi:hypothetical protein
MIRWTYALIDRPTPRFAESSAFWTTVTGTALSARRGADGEFATLVPAGGDACLKLQGVGDAGGAHLDLAVDDVPAEVHRAHDLGAATVVRHREWAVMRSPGGQHFCLVPWHHEAVRPALVTGPDGASSRLDQVCLDIGPAAYDAETAFWAQLTRWELRHGSRPEFAILRPPSVLPIRILLQRLDEQRPSSAHLDLACSDVEAIRTWHEQCGARLVARFPNWLVMTDPANGTYCLTRRDPHTGTLRS